MKRFEEDKGVSQRTENSQSEKKKLEADIDRERGRERESNRTKLHAIRLTDSTTNQNYLLG